MVIVTVFAAIIATLLMTVDRHQTLTGYNVEFTLRDEGSTFEIASLTKSQADNVYAEVENHFLGEDGVFVLQDSKGVQYVSTPKIYENGWDPQYFEGPISWGKYTIIEVSYVDVSLSSSNPLKVTVNYSALDRFSEVAFWLFCVAIIWLYGMLISIFEK